MGIFDKIIGSNTSITFTKEEAVAAVLFLAVCADGDISAEEKELFIAITNRMKLLRSQSAEEFHAMMDKIRDAYNKHTFREVLPVAAQAIPQELKETTFALAADLIFADGSVGEEETTILEAIQQALAIPDDLALKVVEVLQIKNRG